MLVASESNPVSGSLHLNGTFIFETIVILVNVKIFISTNTHTAWSLFWQLGSIGWFFVIFGIETNLHDPAYDIPISGMFMIIMRYVTMYILLFFFVCGFIMVDVGMQMVDNYIED